MKHLLLIIACGFLFAVSAQTGAPPVLKTAKPSPTPAKPTAKKNYRRPAPKQSQLGPSWPAAPQPVDLSNKISTDEAKPRQLFEKALELLRSGKPKDALVLLREAEKLAPKRFEIQMLLGVTFDTLQQRDEAVSAFRKAVAIDAQNADARSGLCHALGSVDKRIEAIDECREAVKLAPTRSKFRAQLAELYLGDNRTDEALQFLMEADARSQADLRFMGTLGDAHFMAGNYELAADVYEKIAQKWPAVALVYLRLSNVYDYLGRVSDSIAAAKKFAELEPTLADAYLNLGQKYQVAGFIDEAITAYTRAISLDKNCGDAYLNLTQMYEITGDTDAMLSSVKNAYRLMPRTVPLAIEYGTLLSSSGYPIEAIEPLEWANSVRPNKPDIMRSLALVYLGADREEEGVALLERANQISPLPPGFKINFVDQKAKKDLIAQLESLQAAVKIRPNDAMVRFKLAIIYVHKKMLTEAEEQYLEFLKLAPSYQAYNTVAIFYVDSRQYEKAIPLYRKAIELNPHHVLYITLSYTLAKLGRLDEAITAAEKAVEIKPTSTDVHLELGNLLLKKGNRPAAVREYQAAFELASGEPRTNFKLAWLYIRMGNKEGAFRHYSILRGIAPNQLEYLEACLIGRFGELP